MWTKLDDGILDHPKIAQLDAVGFGWFVAGLAYVNRALTDGFIPESVAQRLLPVTRYDSDGDAYTLVSATSKYVSDDGETRGGHVGTGLVNTTIDALLAAGLWDEVPGGYQVHDFLVYNLSKDQVLARREGARKRQSRHRHGVTDDVTPDVTRDSQPRHAAPAPVSGDLLVDPVSGSVCEGGTGETSAGAHTRRSRTRDAPRKAGPEPDTNPTVPASGSGAESLPAGCWRRRPPAALTLGRATFALAEVARAGLDVDAGWVDRQWDQYGAHRFKAPRDDVDATWQSWVREAIDYRLRPNGNGGPSPAPAGAPDEVRAAVRALAQMATRGVR